MHAYLPGVIGVAPDATPDRERNEDTLGRKLQHLSHNIVDIILISNIIIIVIITITIIVA